MNGQSRHRSRGQAMAEFVVMTAGCLLLLFVLVPSLAKLSDMGFKAQEVARYTAWERTVWYNVAGGDDVMPSQIDSTNGHLAMRSDLDILNSAENRLMSYSGRPAAFAAQDINTPGQAANNFWRWSHTEEQSSMIEPGAMATASSLSNARTPSTAYAVIDVYNDVMGVVAKIVSILNFGGGDDDFLQIAHPIRNFYTIDIDIPVALADGRLGSKPLFGEEYPTHLNVRARSGILADGWVAQSEEHFSNKVDDFVIGRAIEDNRIWSILRTIIGVFEPSFNDVNFAPVNTDPMPDTETTCDEATGYCYYKDGD